MNGQELDFDFAMLALQIIKRLLSTGCRTGTKEPFQPVLNTPFPVVTARFKGCQIISIPLKPLHSYIFNYPMLEPRIDGRSEQHETWRQMPRSTNGLYVGFSYSLRLNL